MDYYEIEDFIFSELHESLLFYTIIISAVIGKIKESSKRSIITAWLVYFVGTFFHEVAHFITSLLTNGKPRWFSILPSKTVDEKTGRTSYVLGYVSSNNLRWYNVGLVSMAPIILVPVAFFVYENFTSYVEINIYTYVLYIFTMITLIFSAIPSSADFSLLNNPIKVVSKNGKSKNTLTILNYIPLIIIISCAYHFNIYQYIEFALDYSINELIFLSKGM